MHELSIAHQIVEIACAAATRGSAERIDAVHLRLGVLSGVVADSLLFCYDIATAGTLAEGSRLVVEEVPLTVHCPHCVADRRLVSPQSFRCPVCDRPAGRIVAGRELEIDSLEVTP